MRRADRYQQYRLPRLPSGGFAKSLALGAGPDRRHERSEFARHDMLCRFDYCLEQQICQKWLAQIRNATEFHGLAAERPIVERGHEDDWESKASRLQLAPQLETGAIAKLNIDKEAARLARARCIEKCLARRKQLRTISERGQQSFYRLSYSRIIVYDSHDSALNRNGKFSGRIAAAPLALGVAIGAMCRSAGVMNSAGYATAEPA
jgi:hypothetical protein